MYWSLTRVIGYFIITLPQWSNGMLPLKMFKQSQTICLCGATQLVAIISFYLLLYLAFFLCNLQILFLKLWTLGTEHTRGDIMNGTDRKLLRGCITCGTDYLMTIQFDGKIFLQLILLGVLSRLEDAQTSQGRFPWKQRVWSWLWGHVRRRLAVISRRGHGLGSLHKKGCANKCYLSVLRLGLSELSQLRRGAGCLNWHVSHLDSAKLLTYRQSTTLRRSL